MTIRFVLASISLASLAVPMAVARAQQMSVEEIRAGIEAQIRANEASSRGAPAPRTRSLIINNHQDTDEPLYVTPPAAPPPAAGAAPVARPTLNFDNIGFDYDSARLIPSSRPQLLNIAAVIASETGAGHVFMIVGHTDSQGNAAYNRALSQRRAESVVAELERMGVPSDRLSPMGMGMSQPLGKLPPSDPRNRRVEVRLYQ
jgi:outer membrane protein OmpA-like peptidoglycan-associated protein